jgi:hypothetical protein
MSECPRPGRSNPPGSSPARCVHRIGQRHLGGALTPSRPSTAVAICSRRRFLTAVATFKARWLFLKVFFRVSVPEYNLSWCRIGNHRHLFLDTMPAPPGSPPLSGDRIRAPMIGTCRDNKVGAAGVMGAGLCCRHSRWPPAALIVQLETQVLQLPLVFKRPTSKSIHHTGTAG